MSYPPNRPNWRSKPENSLRIFAFAGCRTKFLAGADHRDAAGVPAVAAVLCHRAVNFDLVTEFHRGASPSASLKAMWRSHFPAIVFNAAIRLLHIDVEPDVRVGPFDLGDIALHRRRLTCIELSRKRMVRQSRHCCRCHTESEGKQSNCAFSHLYPPQQFQGRLS